MSKMTRSDIVRRFMLQREASLALSKHLLEPVRCSLLGSWRGGPLTVPFRFPGAGNSERALV